MALHHFCWFSILQYCTNCANIMKIMITCSMFEPKRLNHDTVLRRLVAATGLRRTTSHCPLPCCGMQWWFYPGLDQIVMSRISRTSEEEATDLVGDTKPRSLSEDLRMSPNGSKRCMTSCWPYDKHSQTPTTFLRTCRTLSR